jgi:hypothetical protein
MSKTLGDLLEQVEVDQRIEVEHQVWGHLYPDVGKHT